MIPFLVAKQKKEAKSSATVYESYEGLKTLYEELINELEKSKEDFIAFTLGDEYSDQKLMRFFEHYDLKRKEFGIKTKLIGIESQRKFFKKIYLKQTGLEIKYLPYTAVPQGVIIVGNRVATMIWKENPQAFVIESAELAKSYKKFFESMWKLAKK